MKNSIRAPARAQPAAGRYTPEPLDRRDDIVARYLPLADQLARRFAGRSEPYEDLQQAARLGLVRAASRYDGTRSFPKFAIPTILGELRHHFRDCTWPVHVPRRVQELGLALNRTTDDITVKEGHSPTRGELATALRVTPRDIDDAQRAINGRWTSSIDRDDASDAPAEPASEVPQQTDQTEPVADHLTLATLFAQLPERHQRVLRLRFYANMTQREIAHDVGVSQMHVSRLIHSALHTLRDGIEP
ncbi:sigma-70 family RNA polymerase sigma factor [Prauserella cavernicola]|uniref:Sigma-70 family RNA polymerase sigma factor n=1 Tax=Prauserella cavernicola TaxID=2800127 RepID=A0A934V4T5_9PSEU|nr:sigma-70 family RNA polymerase sigma factor [Prauserella cavernicola]MBK1783928.1 sigma-70 family RNA polymerase sigma factor [Prauserella cavernicola]